MKIWRTKYQIVSIAIIVFGVLMFSGLKAQAATSPLLNPYSPLLMASIIAASDEDPQKDSSNWWKQLMQAEANATQKRIEDIVQELNSGFDGIESAEAPTDLKMERLILI